LWDLNFELRIEWGSLFWDMALYAVLNRPNVGLLYTVLSLTHSLSLSLSLSHPLFHVASARIRVVVFSIEALRSHSDTAFCRTPLDE